MGADSTVFIAEIDSVEAVRSNQKVFDLPLKYTPSSIAATGSFVAIGGEVGTSFTMPMALLAYLPFRCRT